MLTFLTFIPALTVLFCNFYYHRQSRQGEREGEKGRKTSRATGVYCYIFMVKGKTMEKLILIQSAHLFLFDSWARLKSGHNSSLRINYGICDFFVIIDINSKSLNQNRSYQQGPLTPLKDSFSLGACIEQKKLRRP